METGYVILAILYIILAAAAMDIKKLQFWVYIAISLTYTAIAADVFSDKK
jgi:hypothetical protein